MEDKRIEYAKRRAVWLRNYQRARGRALVRLAKDHPDQYRELFEQERAKDEAEGKAWLDISGRTIGSLGSPGSPDRGSKAQVGQTNRDDEEDSDLGGEA